MKIKNLNFMEKHVEKIAIALALVFFGLIMWRYVYGEPYKIQVATRSGVNEVTPDKVEDIIQTQARDLQRLINSTNLPFDEIQLPSWTEDFRNRMTGRFLPVDRLSMPMNRAGLDKSLVTDVPIATPTRVVPTPPAPQSIVAHADYAVLATPADEQQAQQLASLVGNLQQPLDFRYVSVGGVFDFGQWRSRLRDQRVASDQRIPEDWWRYRMLLTDVQLERQELDPVTGQWGEATQVPGLPRQVLTYRNVTTRFPTAEVPALLNGIRDSQDDIARPTFVPLARGMWTPPGADANLSPEQAQELVDIQTRIATLERRSSTTGQATPGRAADAPDAAAPDTGRGQSSELDRLKARRDELLGIVRSTPPAPEMRPNPGAPRPRQRAGQFDNQQPPPGASRPGQPDGSRPAGPQFPPVKLWAHDLTVKPGRTYRYRLVVSVLSPLFHVNDVPREQYTQYFNRLALQGEPSQWSAPVTIDPQLYYFFTSQDTARRQATVDVFRIFNGVWVKRSFDVRPGDPIGGRVELQANSETVPVDMAVNAMVVDILFPPSNMGMMSNADQTRMLVYQLGDQQMVTRVLGQETSNQTLRRLLQEIQIRSALAANAGL